MVKGTLGSEQKPATGHSGPWPLVSGRRQLGRPRGHRKGALRRTEGGSGTGMRGLRPHVPGICRVMDRGSAAYISRAF